jgi:hypothetical protein
MRLRFSGKYRHIDEINICRSFESMGRGLLLVRLDFQPKHCSPYHWFLESKRKPPFDIALRPEDGSITYIKFFFQDEKIENNNTIINCVVENEGLPLFDISDFNDKNYQHFEDGNVDVYLYKRDMHVKVSGAKEFRNINLDKQNSVIVDEEGFFVGLIMKELTQVEINELIQAEVILK